MKKASSPIIFVQESLKVIFSFLFHEFIIISYSFFLFLNQAALSPRLSHAHTQSARNNVGLIVFLSLVQFFDKDVCPNLHLWNFSFAFLFDFSFSSDI